MKKVVASILCLVLMMTSFAFAAEVFEKPEFNILVNGVEVDKTDVPIVIEGRTLVPLRTLAVALGVPNDDEHIIWNAEERKVTVIRDEMVGGESGPELFTYEIIPEIRIELVIDSNIAYVNGENKVIDVPATLYNGRTYLPARFVAESFEKYVGWDGETGTITISDEPIAEVEPIVNDAAVILKKSQEAMKDVKSTKADMNMSMDITAQGMTISMDMTGTMSVDMNKKQMYGDFDMTMNMMGMSMPAEMSMYMENDKMYMRTVSEGEDSGWIDATEGSDVSLADVWTLAEQSEQIEMPEEFYAAFEIAGNENGCTVIKTKDDLTSVLNTIIKEFLNSNQELASSANVDLTNVEYKMYINDSTNYNDKVEMGMIMNATAEGETIAIDFDVVMNMSEFNTVEITNPAN